MWKKENLGDAADEGVDEDDAEQAKTLFLG